MTQTREQVEAQLRELLVGFNLGVEDYSSVDEAIEAFCDTIEESGSEFIAAFLDSSNAFVAIRHPEHGEVVVALSDDGYDMYYGEGKFRDPVRKARDERSDHITGDCGPDCPYSHDWDNPE